MTDEHERQLQNTFKVYYFQELLERVIRYDLFLEFIKSDDDVRRVNIIKSLDKLVAELRKRLGEELLPLVLVENLQTRHYEAVIRKLRILSENIQTIHQKTLVWLYTPWAKPEVYIFLEGLFRNGGGTDVFRKLNGDVVFVDEYNFWGHKVDRDLQEIQELPAANVWALPKIEYNNVLMWPMLLHEVGHSLSLYYEIEDRARELFDRKWRGPVPPEMKAKLANWCKEISADLIAQKVLGVAYLCAVLAHATVFITSNLNNSDPAYPSIRLRYEILRRGLSDAGMNLGAKEYAIVEEFIELFHMRRQIDHGLVNRGNFDDAVMPNQAAEEEEMANQLAALIEEVQRERLKVEIFTASNFKNAAEMLGRLTNGVLVSSSAGEAALASGRAQLEQLGKEASGSESDVQRFRDILISLREEPCRVSEIVNGGWLYRMSKWRQDFDENFLDCWKKSKDFDLAYRRFSQHVDYRDEILLTSIERSLVHQFYTGG